MPSGVLDALQHGVSFNHFLTTRCPLNFIVLSNLLVSWSKCCKCSSSEEGEASFCTWGVLLSSGCVPVSEVPDPNKNLVGSLKIWGAPWALKWPNVLSHPIPSRFIDVLFSSGATFNLLGSLLVLRMPSWQTRWCACLYWRHPPVFWVAF